MKDIIKKDGLIGFYRGYSALLLRDPLSYGFYFFLYEYIRRGLKKQGLNNELTLDFISGGLAGKM